MDGTGGRCGWRMAELVGGHHFRGDWCRRDRVLAHSRKREERWACNHAEAVVDAAVAADKLRIAVTPCAGRTDCLFGHIGLFHRDIGGEQFVPKLKNPSTQLQNSLWATQKYGGMGFAHSYGSSCRSETGIIIETNSSIRWGRKALKLEA